MRYDYMLSMEKRRKSIAVFNAYYVIPIIFDFTVIVILLNRYLNLYATPDRLFISFPLKSGHTYLKMSY